jgi:hypothetical protein
LGKIWKNCWENCWETGKPFSNRGFKWKINYTWRFRAAKIVGKNGRIFHREHRGNGKKIVSGVTVTEIWWVCANAIVILRKKKVGYLWDNRGQWDNYWVLNLD